MRTVPSHRTPQPALILLVDDNRDGTIARKSVLEALGYTVITARSGIDALQLISEHEFDLIVTDYKMPSMDGLTLIAELRSRALAAPIILLTGFADALGLNENTTGANLVIQKSANEIGHLVRAAKRLLPLPPSPFKKPITPIRPTRKRAASGES